MRCSICDAQKTQFIFHNWHCTKCVVEIKKAIGLSLEDDEDYYIDSDFDSLDDNTVSLGSLSVPLDDNGE